MTKGNRKFAAWMLAVCFAVSVFYGCTAEEGFSAGGQPELSDPEYVRTPPPLLQAEFVGTVAERRDVPEMGRSAVVDVTNASKGYVAVQCTAPAKARFRVAKGGDINIDSDTYLLYTDGRTSYFPLTKGSGTYTLLVMINVDGNSYDQYLTYSFNATLESEFAPFLVNSQEVQYSSSSEVVKLSYELTEHCVSDLEVAQQIYYWISRNITYDQQKAIDVNLPGREPYVPDPDDTLATRTGICYDYAALAAAMLRANGIPTKLVKGDVMAGEQGWVLHAWNLIYLEETGWITIELPTKPRDWQRIDLTFQASGGRDMARFIGDGENYTDISFH